MGLTDRRDPAEVTVTVRHRCPDFAFGSILGPYASSAWWIARPGDRYLELIDPEHAYDGPESNAATLAILAALGSGHDLRRHLDELAERPDVP